jgi:hypothetical protein
MSKSSPRGGGSRAAQNDCANLAPMMSRKRRSPIDVPERTGPKKKETPGWSPKKLLFWIVATIGGPAIGYYMQKWLKENDEHHVARITVMPRFAQLVVVVAITSCGEVKSGVRLDAPASADAAMFDAAAFDTATLDDAPLDAAVDTPSACTSYGGIFTRTRSRSTVTSRPPPAAISRRAGMGPRA